MIMVSGSHRAVGHCGFRQLRLVIDQFADEAATEPSLHT
jgi:hypothetical protein